VIVGCKTVLFERV